MDAVDVVVHASGEAEPVGERVDEGPEADPLDDAFDVHVYSFERGHRASVRLIGVVCMRIGRVAARSACPARGSFLTLAEQPGRAGQTAGPGGMCPPGPAVQGFYRY
ncbi:hypothetical protein GCM10009850_032410 [Nonomuraea monospora]|uniref:Uncharacterized protein n=1 Tax=Nonomuraea monospora TaxID=568818 RepID=A0ABN3CEG5_9ACTN